MKQLHQTVCCVTLAFVAVASFAGFAPAKPASMLPSFAGYQHWRLVNAVPFFVPDKRAALCISLSPEMAAKLFPHDGKFIQVYVNPAAEHAMFSRKPAQFPEGSVIVKQKMSRKEGPVELLTVMRKGKHGSDPKTGDWEYFVTDASGAKINGYSDIGRCMACHASRKSSDYVFKDYLPNPDGSPATPLL